MISFFANALYGGSPDVAFASAPLPFYYASCLRLTATESAIIPLAGCRPALFPVFYLPCEPDA
ncbi:hypothetical protein KCP77_13655 [Salmonella enterica subsp. enterica]|nr:hypothetical protein KCP77_13655 [Salmonella enterica subsp. enterica]